MESIESTLAAPGGGVAAGAEIRVGTPIGRYLVLAQLGAGGMGVVYTAFDPKLDRKVALKLVLPDARDPEQGRRRLLREAQALARLRHPNVVAVHDVGVHGEAIFVAMELVPGRSLRAWLQAAGGRRPWRAVVPVFAQLAQGLAAAHEVGLVHRDFKPDNALVDEHGRVCVLDFGLARAVEGSPSAAEFVPPSGTPVTAAGAATAPVPGRMLEQGEIAAADTTPAPSAEVSAFSEPLTRQGALLGTPSYMAPEQLRGLEVDGRCDQYALCVSMFEALYGRRPFTGANPVMLLEAITAGVRDVPEGVKVPAWLHRVVLRGLSVDPAARWPSMNALAAALSRAPGRRRTAFVAGALVIVGGAATAAIVSREDPCADAQARLDPAWSSGRRTETIAAMAAIARPYAAATAAGVVKQLDAYGAQWTAMYEQACRATHERREQSAELLDRRMACLDTRRRALEGFTGLLLQPDAALLERAVEAAGRLPAIRDCGDLERLLAVAAPPSDAESRAAFDAARDRLAAATAAELAGHYAEGVEAAEAATADARTLGLAALFAEAELVRGRLLEGAGRHTDADAALRSAVYQAQLADHERAQAEAALELVYVAGYRQSRFDEGKWWAELTRGLVDRLADALLAARLDNHLGVLLHAAGELDAAVGYLERALDGRTAALGPDHLDVAESHYNLAISLRRRGQLDEARAHHDRALAIRVAALGPEHPRVAESHAAIAVVAVALGDLPAALAAFERAAAIQRASLGPRHPKLADTLTGLGSARALAGDPSAAIANYRESLAILEASVGVDNTQVDRTQHNLAVALAEVGDHAAAAELFERVAAARERHLGPRHADLGRTLTQLGRAQIELGRLPEAIDALERALAILEPGGDALATARAQVGLALALRADKRDPGRVQTLATAAKTAFAAAGPAGAAGLAEAERVLAE